MEKDNNTTSRRRETELSEQDAIHVFDLIAAEFPIDRAHVYLFGHSAGGTGGWYIGAKYADRFAGLALSAFGTRPEGFPFDKLQGKALMPIVGTEDAPRTVQNVRDMAKAVRERFPDSSYLEIEGANHDTIVGLAVPRVFGFFDQDSRNK